MEHKFKIGDKIKYVVDESILFTGEIIGLDPNKKHKPYIIKDKLGFERYANEKYLFLL